MKRNSILVLIIMLMILGCGKNVPVKEDITEDEESFVEWVLTIEDSVQIPTKDLVYEKREEVLEGMSEEEIYRLRENIKMLNLDYEHKHLYDNFFERIKDPKDLYWNYVDTAGEIQIGWAYDGEERYDESCGMTKTEWEASIGTPVMTKNDMDAEVFIKLMTELKSSVESGLLDEDFDNLISNMSQAKETHEVKYLEKVYHILHDMDYFLLRYGIDDVAPYTDDDSMVTSYYGVLEVYN